MNEKLPKTLLEATRYFADPQTCIDFVASLRWENGVAVCPHCGNNETYFLATRKIFKCKAKECRKQFSIKTNTIFEDSAISLDKWLVAIWLIANAKNGISSYELHRALGITQKSAWFVLHRIRLAMGQGSIEKASGDVEIDESYIGGTPRNMHHKKRQALGRYGSKLERYDHKTAVVGILERKGKIRAKVVKKVRREQVVPFIYENVEEQSNIFTDQSNLYLHLHHDYIHETVHHAREYVRGNVHTNSIENFWSLLKRTIKGTYVSIQAEHLQKYVEEQCFRYNNRETNDQGRFLEMIKSISGKRLTYAQLVGYETPA